VGSPPGYVGHEEGGQLTERVRRRPYSVVLFDEVEKAHPDVMNLLLQILEEGRLTDSLGRQVDFRNTVVILTSNLGYDHERQGQGLGFVRESAAEDYDRLRERMLNAAKQVFKPELINRFDEVIVFRKISKADVVKILDLEMVLVRSRLEAKGITLELTDQAIDLLVDKGYNPAHGARPLRRTVERFLEDPLAEELLRGVLTQGVVQIDIAADKQSLTFRMRDELPLRSSGSQAKKPKAATKNTAAKKTATKKKGKQTAKKPAARKTKKATDKKS
jgi:ATP-dependent Clp protease ATP-binding subunit ClpC